MLIFAIKTFQAAARTGMVLTFAAFAGVVLQPLAESHFHYSLQQATRAAGCLFVLTALMLYALACLPCPACRKSYIGNGNKADPFATGCQHCGAGQFGKKDIDATSNS